MYVSHDELTVLKQDKYKVESVKKTNTPEGLIGDNWYQYIIGYGSSTINGTKPGTLKDVTQHAESVALDLNTRSKSPSSTYAPKQTQRKTSR